MINPPDIDLTILPLSGERLQDCYGADEPKYESENDKRQKIKVVLEKHNVPFSDALLDELLSLFSEELEEAFNSGYGCGANQASY